MSSEGLSDIQRVFTLPLATDSNEKPAFSGSSSPNNVSKEKFDELGLVREGEVEPKDTVTACLQVVGAFFLMFNSWYYHTPLVD